MEFMSESAIGPFGYAIDKGLIPLPETLRREEREKARTLAAKAARRAKTGTGAS